MVVEQVGIRCVRKVAESGLKPGHQVQLRLPVERGCHAGPFVVGPVGLLTAAHIAATDHLSPQDPPPGGNRANTADTDRSAGCADYWLVLAVG
ncbi:hypothetical protein MNVI_44250 [Mycobacterium noviomagense]|uniref:Uncharacterized protein n=1 Tax=Mycobacterium noviomagense TaxID=459858 RepID=A0A7I7PKE3_9MYCO|nr:hypothetical protein MNVI_44250 [Mycobacterium noviomagense]